VQLLKTVFHVHTDYSDDSDNTVAHIIESAGRLGVRCLAVTDHDTIEGARVLAAEADSKLKVIVGQEISTCSGHLIGLFLQDCIVPGMSPRRTAKAIKAQGGLVVAAHPFNSIFSCGLRKALYDFVDLIDVVEIANSQNLLPFADRKSAKFAQAQGLPALVGSDTHQQNNLDSCYQWLEPFDGPNEFLESVRHAQLVPGRHRLAYFFRTAAYLTRYYLGFGFPARFGHNCTVSRTQRLLPHSAAPAKHVLTQTER